MSRAICIAVSSKVVSRRGWIGRHDLLALLLSTRNGVFSLPLKYVFFSLVHVGGNVLDGSSDSARTCRTLHPLALLLPEGQRDGRRDPGLQLSP